MSDINSLTHSQLKSVTILRSCTGVTSQTKSVFMLILQVAQVKFAYFLFFGSIFKDIGPIQGLRNTRGRGLLK